MGTHGDVAQPCSPRHQDGACDRRRRLHRLVGRPPSGHTLPSLPCRLFGQARVLRVFAQPCQCRRASQFSFLPGRHHRCCRCPRRAVALRRRRRPAPRSAVSRRPLLWQLVLVHVRECVWDACSPRGGQGAPRALIHPCLDGRGLWLRGPRRRRPPRDLDSVADEPLRGFKGRCRDARQRVLQVVQPARHHRPVQQRLWPYPEKIIPKFICLLLRNQKLILHGDGSPTRRYLYGGDAADAFDFVLSKGVVGQTYNVGSEDEVSNIDLCRTLLRTFDRPVDDEAHLRAAITFVRDRPFNDHRYAIDGSKLKALGWRQSIPLSEGLPATVHWYREHSKDWWGPLDDVLTAFPVEIQADARGRHELRAQQAER